MHDQDETERGYRDAPPKQVQAGQSDEERLIAIFRSLSAENQRNVMRYVEAVGDIEAIFDSTQRNH